MPVGSLQSHEVCNEEKEIANGGGDPGSEHWNLFKGWQVEAEDKDCTWKDSTLDQNVIDDYAVLDTEASKETFQHGSDRVKENVEDEQLVHGQNGVLHVQVVSDFVNEVSHEDLKTHALEYWDKDLEYKHRSVVVFGGHNICATDFLSTKRGTSRSQRVSDDEAEHHATEQSDRGVLLSNTKPSSDEGQKLPLPGVNPEHYKLRDTVVHILAQVAASFEGWTETRWLHSNINMLYRSQNKICQEVCNESCNRESLSSQSLHLDTLIANQWVANSNSEEVSEARCPELVEAVEESSVGIANTPEPQWWQKMHKVLLSHVSILFVLLQELWEQESTIHGCGDDTGKKHSPQEETSVEDVAWKFDSVGG